MQVTINNELIKKVAKNARLKLTDEEIKNFEKDFKEILNSFEEIEKLDTENTEPAFHPIEIKNKTREDKVKPSIPRDELLSNTKHKKDGYFQGPKAL